MRVAVFGERGFIGKEFVKIVPEGHKIFAFNRPEFDIRKLETYREKLNVIQPDVVVNMAARVGTLISTLSVKEMFETNTMGALDLAHTAYEAGARRYIYISSTVVHGENKKGEHYGRFSKFGPKHPYSASKAAAEYSLEQFAKEKGDVVVITLRPPMVIGKGTNPDLPAISFVRDILSGKEIKIFGEGLHEREFVSVGDVARGIWKAIDWGKKAQQGYHPFFLSGNRISMRDLAEKVIKKFGGKVVYIPKTIQAFSLTTDASETKQILGWEPYDDLDAILADVARHI